MDGPFDVRDPAAFPFPISLLHRRGFHSDEAKGVLGSGSEARNALRNISHDDDETTIRSCVSLRRKRLISSRAQKKLRRGFLTFAKTVILSNVRFIFHSPSVTLHRAPPTQ